MITQRIKLHEEVVLGLSEGGVHANCTFEVAGNYDQFIKVSADGTITGLKAGAAIVVVKDADGEEVQKTIVIVEDGVSPAAQAPTTTAPAKQDPTLLVAVHGDADANGEYLVEFAWESINTASLILPDGSLAPATKLNVYEPNRAKVDEFVDVQSSGSTSKRMPSGVYRFEMWKMAGTLQDQIYGNMPEVSCGPVVVGAPTPLAPKITKVEIVADHGTSYDLRVEFTADPLVPAHHFLVMSKSGTFVEALSSPVAPVADGKYTVLLSAIPYAHQGTRAVMVSAHNASGKSVSETVFSDALPLVALQATTSGLSLNVAWDKLSPAPVAGAPQPNSVAIIVSDEHGEVQFVYPLATSGTKSLKLEDGGKKTVKIMTAYQAGSNLLLGTAQRTLSGVSV